MAQQRLIVLVGHDQWRVVHFNGWRYHALHSFSADTESQELLLDRLKQYAGAIVYFLTDIADEHYHIEVLPHVGGAAKKKLLARRLAAWPFAQGLHTLNKVGSVQSVRKEDLYLFSAIHYPPLREWLQALKQQAMRVQGVYTQPLCIPCWASPLQSGQAQCLTVYFERQQLRIHYLYQSRLLFSRLLTLTPDASLNIRISSEIAQTRLYLMNQKWLQENELLHLLWLSEGANNKSLPLEQLPAGIRQTCLSYADVMHQSGWKPVPSGLSFMDWAAIQVVLHTLKLPNFAPEISMLSDRVLAAKRNITVVSLVMICLLIMTNWMSQQSLQHTQFNIQQTQAHLRRWQAATPALGVAEADLPRLQTFSRAVQSLEASARFPDRALTLLQEVLAGQQVWQVKEITWSDGSLRAPGQEPSANPDSHWPEMVSITFFRIGDAASQNAHEAWRLLLQTLRQHPDIRELKEVNVPASSASSVQQGDTRQSLSPDNQPTIMFRLRPIESAAA